MEDIVMKMTVQSFCFRDSIKVVITFSMYTVNMNSEELIFHEVVYIYYDGTCIIMKLQFNSFGAKLPKIAYYYSTKQF